MCRGVEEPQRGQLGRRPKRNSRGAPLSLCSLHLAVGGGVLCDLLYQFNRTPGGDRLLRRSCSCPRGQPVDEVRFQQGWFRNNGLWVSGVQQVVKAGGSLPGSTIQSETSMKAISQGR